MRPIDAEALSEGIELHRKGTDQECESDRQWAVGYNAGLDRALYSIAYAKTVCLQSSEPLTLEELREMDGEPVWITPGGFWALVIARRGERVRLINHEGEIVWADKEIELVGPVYRRRPEEG